MNREPTETVIKPPRTYSTKPKVIIVKNLEGETVAQGTLRACGRQLNIPPATMVRLLAGTTKVSSKNVTVTEIKIEG